ncbi:MAG: glycosyltransferase family protein [Alcanivorax sediminis]|uniref:glycosyltransferase n=1 Tax=Alcanivorax sediminis TaxID=2663008 RepID=UPI003C4587FC
MKTLIVSTDGKLMVTRPLWEAARQFFEFDHVEVTREHGLEAYFNEADFSAYDRVIADTNLRRLGKRYQCLKRAPGLVVFDHDVCQNNVPTSEWYHRYPAVLRDLGKVRIIVSGASLAEQLQQEGIDACYLPKGYDDTVITALDCERTHSAAFVGRVKNKVYKRRKKFLLRQENLGRVELLRADPGEPYNRLLNQIRVFVSADIGFGEYMIKNFEAMAAGCVLLAWRQPAVEQASLGFVDGENVALYDSEPELLEKLAWLNDNPDVCAGIALAGQKLVSREHTWTDRAKAMPALLAPEIQMAPPPNWIDRLRIMGAGK